MVFANMGQFWWNGCETIKFLSYRHLSSHLMARCMMNLESISCPSSIIVVSQENEKKINILYDFLVTVKVTQSSRKRRITCIGTHNFFPGTHDFRKARVPHKHVFFSRHALKI